MTRTRMARTAREQQLLDVAEELFLRQGFAATSIEDISRAAGVTRPVVYDLLGDKDAVLLACSARARRLFEERLAEVFGGHDPQDLPAVVEATSAAFFRMLAENPARWELFFTNASPLAGRIAGPLGDLRFATTARVIELSRPFAPGVSERRLAMFAHGLSGLGEQLGRYWLRDPGTPIDEVIATHRDFTLAMAAAITYPPRPRSAPRS